MSALFHVLDLCLHHEGDLAARYRKIHLFDVCVPGVVDFQESALISSGKEVRRAHTTLAYA